MYKKYFVTSFRAKALLSSSISCQIPDSIPDSFMSSALERSAVNIIRHMTMVSTRNRLLLIRREFILLVPLSSLHEAGLVSPTHCPFKIVLVYCHACLERTACSPQPSVS